MSDERIAPDDPRVLHAVGELRALISHHYPDATFDVHRGDDPEGIYVWAQVNLEDPEPVADLVMDRLLEMQVEQTLPVHVIPIRTPELSARVFADSRRRARRLHIGVVTLNP